MTAEVEPDQGGDAEKIRSGAGRIDWRFVAVGFGRTLLPLWFLYCGLGLVTHYAEHPTTIWPDARIYYRATAAWLDGGNPWEAEFNGIRYAAPPPALLLNVPLVPLGEDASVALWVGAGTASIALILRRLQLPIWWVMFYPIAEGWSGSSPDLVLAYLVFVGGGALAGLTKPYSVPALIAERRYVALGLAIGIGLATIPLLPWEQFFASRVTIEATFEEWAYPNSSWGNPLLMAGAAIALVLLGRERGFGLLTPAIIGQQPHYAVFSLQYVARSRLLAAFATVPVFGYAAFGVMLYALVDRLGRRRHADGVVGDRPQTPDRAVLSG